MLNSITKSMDAQESCLISRGFTLRVLGVHIEGFHCITTGFTLSIRGFTLIPLLVMICN